MRSAGASWAAMLLLAWAAPTVAQVANPRQEYEEATGRPKPAPVIPSQFREMIDEATPDLLVVRGVEGQLIPVTLEWIEPINFRAFYERRYLGFEVSGHEAEGYTLVDRHGRGASAVIHTGQRPIFSPNGRWFAAAEMTESGFGNLNGVALWEILPNRTLRRLFTDALPRAFDWRMDGWVRSNCVAMSAVEIGWQPPEGQDWQAALRGAPRVHYQLEVGEEFALTPRGDGRPCQAEEN